MKGWTVGPCSQDRTMNWKQQVVAEEGSGYIASLGYEVKKK